MEERRASLWAGTAVVISLVAFLVILNVYVNWKSSSDGFLIHLKFNFLNGVTIGSPVKLSGGRNIGKVHDMYQKNLQTFLVLKLGNEMQGKIPVNDDTKFAIFSTSLFGQKYINLEMNPARPGEKVLGHNDVFTGVDPPSIDAMLTSLSYWFEGKSEEEVIAGMRNKMNLLSVLFASMMQENREDVSYISGVLKVYYDNLGPKLKIIETRLEESSQVIKGVSREDLLAISRNMETIATNYDSMQAAVRMQKGSAGKILSDNKIKKNMDEAVRYSKEFIQCINEHPLVLVYRESCPE